MGTWELMTRQAGRAWGFLQVLGPGQGVGMGGRVPGQHAGGRVNWVWGTLDRPGSCGCGGM